MLFTLYDSWQTVAETVCAIVAQCEYYVRQGHLSEHSHHATVAQTVDKLAHVVSSLRRFVKLVQQTDHPTLLRTANHFDILPRARYVTMRP